MQGFRSREITRMTPVTRWLSTNYGHFSAAFLTRVRRIFYTWKQVDQKTDDICRNSCIYHGCCWRHCPWRLVFACTFWKNPFDRTHYRRRHHIALWAQYGIIAHAPFWFHPSFCWRHQHKNRKPQSRCHPARLYKGCDARDGFSHRRDWPAQNRR